jgi:Mn-dependent DtxR family transcriptional regulator
MPVSIDEFESGDLPEGPSVPEQVITYLHTNRDAAFTRSEIATAIDEDPNTVGTALTRLKERNLVRHRGQYWAITKDEQRVAAAYDLHDVSSQFDDADGGIDPEDWDAVAPDAPHPSEKESNGDE